jgi:putative transposase
LQFRRLKLAYLLQVAFRFGGTEPSDAAKLREFEAKNIKLKKLLAEAHLDIHALTSVFSVKR